MSVEKMSAKNIICFLPLILMSKYQNDEFEKNIEKTIAIIIENEKAFPAENPLKPRAFLFTNLVKTLLQKYELKSFTNDLNHVVTAARTAASTK